MTRKWIGILVMTAGIAAAHDEPRWGGSSGSGYRDSYGGYGSSRGGWRGGTPVPGVVRELQSIASRARVDRHEAGHFHRAIDALAEYESLARRGRVDYRLLDRALDNMAHLAQAHQVHPRDRARVRDLMRSVASFREDRYSRSRW